MRAEIRHLLKWVDSGNAVLLPAEVSRNLVEHLGRLPWIGTRLNWDVLDGIRANLSVVDLLELPRWIKSTALHSDEYMIYVFERDDPCIACKLEFGLMQIDFVYSASPGMNYFFGAEMVDGSISPLLDHFAEYDGADSLFVKR